MIASIKRQKSNANDSASHARFIAMLPAICSFARYKFRADTAERREELTQEVVANAWRAYRRLVELGKQDLAYAGVLARFAVQQVRAGRRIGGKESPRDVMSKYVQRRKGFIVERLHGCDAVDNEWQEIVLEDKRATPAEIAAIRLDFACWLKLLSKRERKIALTLAKGETTSGAARTFGLTAARISQLRGWLRQSWERFQYQAEVKLAEVATS